MGETLDHRREVGAAIGKQIVDAIGREPAQEDLASGRLDLVNDRIPRVVGRRCDWGHDLLLIAGLRRLFVPVGRTRTRRSRLPDSDLA
ncbi:hypothetical protein [Sphingomonas sp. MS122]|uniref:hypothetical protein n=1 Tax=Sphingomonas sp. MS122 TaxID=3412683 RepID=UPI003C2DDD74